MIFTEDEAKGIWCPMAPDTHNCKGTKCAAWRWKTKETNFKPKGYCGLAGAVEVENPGKGTE